jgi:hypothetical protein
VAVLLVAVAAAGLLAQRSAGNKIALPVALAGLAGVALAAVSAVAPELAGHVVTGIPGGGLLRDSHKLVATWSIAVAVGLGGAVTAILGYEGRARELAGPAIVVLAASGVLILPSLATGLGGRLTPVRYPADYPAVSALLHRSAGPDDLAVVLPWQPYRAYDWTGGRTVLDPLPRWLPTTTVTDDDLTVGGTTVSGEGPLAAQLDPVLSAPGPLAGGLASADVRWVLVERRTGTPAVDRAALAGLVRVRGGRDIELWRVPGVPRGAGRIRADSVRPPLAVVLVADVLAALVVAAGLVFLCWRGPAGSRRPGQRPHRGVADTLR